MVTWLTRTLGVVAASARTIVLRRPSTLALLWTIAGCTGAAELLVSGAVVGPPTLLLRLAVGLGTITAAATLLLGVRAGVALYAYGAARRRTSRLDDAVRREAAAGIAQIEAFLARDGRLRDH